MLVKVTHQRVTPRRLAIRWDSSCTLARVSKPSTRHGTLRRNPVFRVTKIRSPGCSLERDQDSWLDDVFHILAMLSRERSTPPDFRQPTSATVQHTSTSYVLRRFRERTRRSVSLPYRSAAREVLCGTPSRRHACAHRLPFRKRFEEPRVTVSPERPEDMHLCRGPARVTAGRAGSLSRRLDILPTDFPRRKTTATNTRCFPSQARYPDIIRSSVALAMLSFRTRRLRPTPL